MEWSQSLVYLERRSSVVQNVCSSGVSVLGRWMARLVVARREPRVSGRKEEVQCASDTFGRGVATLALLFVYVPLVLVSFVLPSAETTASTARRCMRSRTPAHAAEVLHAVLGVRLVMVSAQVGHTSELEILALAFVALESRLVGIDVSDWLVVGMRASRAAGFLGSRDCVGRW